MKSKESRVLYWPIAFSIAWPVALILVWSGPLDLAPIGALLVLFFWMVSLAPALALAVQFAIERNWLRSLAMLPLPMITFVAALYGEFVWRTTQNVGQYVHFFAMRPVYISEISRLPTNEPRLILFDWGGWFLHSKQVVYDESDEITSAHPSEAWKKRAHRTDLACGIIGYTPIGDHFYFVSIDC